MLLLSPSSFSPTDRPTSNFKKRANSRSPSLPPPPSRRASTGPHARGPGAAPADRHLWPKWQPAAVGCGSKLFGMCKRPLPPTTWSEQVEQDLKRVKDDAFEHTGFNAKSKENYRLSNFFGPPGSIPEFKYQKEKFQETHDGLAIRALLDKWQHIDDVDEFVRVLHILQPDKKFTPRKDQYWVKDGKPILGILAKLVGGALSDMHSANKRLQAIILRATGKTVFIKDMNEWRAENLKPIWSHDEADQVMRWSVQNKYEHPEYQGLLLQTGDAELHEHPTRGAPNHWTYKDGAGGDALGKILCEVRDDIRRSSADP